MTEVWRPIEGHKHYEVSNYGRVRSVTRRVNIGNGAVRLFKSQIIKPWITKNTGYPQVQLSNRKKQSVHRVVAKAFCEGYESGLDVNHLNGDRQDNRASNLEWVTRKENIRHAYKSLGRKGSCKGRYGKKHPTSKSVVRIHPVTGDRKYYESGSDAHAEGFTSTGISRVCKGKGLTHKGYKWEYA